MADIKVRDKQTGEVFTVREKAPFQFGGGGAPGPGVGGATPERTGLETAGLRARSFATSAANIGLAGIPEFVQQKLTGQPFVPPGAPGFAAAGGLLGFGLGVPGKVLKGASALASKAIPSTRFLPQVLKGAITGAATGAALLPSPAEAPTFKESIAETGRRMKIGATIGGLTQVAAAPFKFTRWLKAKNQLKLAEKARRNISGQKHLLNENYGKRYDEIVANTKGNVNLNEPFRNLLENTDDSLRDIQGQFEFNTKLAEGSASAKRLNNLVRTFLKEPNVPRTVSIQDANNLQRAIKQLPGLSSKIARAQKIGFEQVDFTNSERILLELSNDIKAQVLNTAPDMAFLNSQYAGAINKLKQIRPFFKFGKAVNTIRNFKDVNRVPLEVRDLIQQSLPKNILTDINAVNNATRAATLGKIALKRGAFIAGAGAVAGAVGGRVLGGFGGE